MLKGPSSIKHARMSLWALLVCISTQADSSVRASDAAATAINQLGLDLLPKAGRSDANLLLSPFSIQSALAMTYAGAADQTREEMRRVLHYAPDESALHESFNDLRRALDEITRASAKRAAASRPGGGPGDPISLTIANRLFGEEGYEFREPFLALTRDVYYAPFQAMSFSGNPEVARKDINAWVEDRTRQRIRDLIPPDGVNRETRLVLVNAIYLKAPWAEPFAATSTSPAPFHARGGPTVNVPTMRRQGHLGHAQHEGFRAVTIPYAGGDLQFFILLPEQTNGLTTLQAKVTPQLLAQTADARMVELILHVPKFKLEPPLLKLGELLEELGMRSAFDKPRGSANFDRMAPRRPNDYLFLSEVFHKTFLDLDEKGTEAAATTAVVMARATSVALEKPKPIEVKVDRPFLFGIQHRASGACLFLGRLTDPR